MKNNILLYITFILFFISCKENKKEEFTDDDYKAFAANIMSQPKFYGEDIVKKITDTDFKIKTYYYDTRVIYAFIDKKLFDTQIKKFVIDIDSINIGQISGNSIWLGNHYINDSNQVLFKTDAKNLNIDRQKPIQIKFKDATYTTNLEDIHAFINMDNLIKGGIYAVDKKGVALVSHGSAVAKNDIKSLKDFALKLTEHAKTNEEKAQILLDFVTLEIEYNFDEAYAFLETIKRPNEILFTKNSDCSGKSILYASLLQQVGIDWCLAYYYRHINVGIAGNFNPKNPVKFNFKNKEYFIAETTAPASKIGEDEFKSKLNAQFIEYVHNPNRDKYIYNYKTKEPLEYATKTVVE